jgi:hypothetical protein
MLEVFGRRGGVVAEAHERIVDAFCRKQRERLGRAGQTLMTTIGNGVVDLTDARQGKDALHRLDMVVGDAFGSLLDRKGQRDRSVAHADLQRDIVMTQQKVKLLAQIGCIEFRARERGGVAARRCHHTVRQIGSGQPRRTIGFDRDIGITRIGRRRFVITGGKGLEPRIKPGDRVIIKLHDPC